MRDYKRETVRERQIKASMTQVYNTRNTVKGNEKTWQQIKLEN